MDKKRSSKPFLQYFISENADVQGGRGYKKGRHDESKKLPECDTDDGQMWARVLKEQGNRRFRVFCNDNKERTCKLAGSIRKSQWVEEGTIVIISLRGLSSATGGHSSANTDDIGDIIEVVERGFISKLKKDTSINPALFTNLDDEGVKKRLAAGGKVEEDDFFEEADEEQEEEEEEHSLTPEQKQQKKLAREKKAKERDIARSARRDNKNEDDVNIDEL